MSVNEKIVNILLNSNTQRDDTMKCIGFMSEVMTNILLSINFKDISATPVVNFWTQAVSKKKHVRDQHVIFRIDGFQ